MTQCLRLEMPMNPCGSAGQREARVLTGTFDTIPVTDVLDLLIGTSKTGTLVLSGTAPTTRLEFHRGRLVDVEPGVDDTTLDERFVRACFLFGRDGRSRFEFRALPPAEAEPEAIDVQPVLDDLRGRLDRWIAVVGEIGSIEQRFALSDTLHASDVRLDGRRWRWFAHLAQGESLDALADSESVDVLDAAEAAAELVRIGALAPAPTPAPPARGRGGKTEPVDAVELDDEPTEPIDADVADESTDFAADELAAILAGDPEMSRESHEHTSAEPAETTDVQEIDASGDGAGGQEPAENEALADVTDEIAEGAEGDEVPAGPVDGADRGAILRLFSALKDA
jgi:hypothetical protein